MQKNRKSNRGSFEAAKLIQKMKNERHGKINKMHQLIVQKDIEFAKAYDGIFELLMARNRRLSAKVKELIVMGILAAKGEYDSLGTHIRRAIVAGIDQRELLEVLELAMLYGGAESMMRGGMKLIEVSNHGK